MALISAAKKAANQRNAKLSPGPKTEEGKQNSSRNAIRHGLTCRELTFPNDIGDDAEEFIQAIKEQYDPQTAQEAYVVAEITSLMWRTRRAAAFETDLFNEIVNSPLSRKQGDLHNMFRYVKELATIKRYETASQRELHKNIAFLTELQAKRLAATQQPPAPEPQATTIKPAQSSPQPQTQTFSQQPPAQPANPTPQTTIPAAEPAASQANPFAPEYLEKLSKMSEEELKLEQEWLRKKGLDLPSSHVSLK